MPEGPEVKLISDVLKKIIGGKVITSISVNERWRHYPDPPVEVDEPLKIVDISYRSKKIIFTLLPVSGGNFVYLVSRLGMEGKWITERGKHSGVEMKFSDGTSIFYDDTRHFGDLNFAEDEDELWYYFRDSGPDYLIDEITEEMYLSVLKKKSVANKEVCEFLLSQKYFSGVGNYLRSDIMYAAGINPRRLISDLDEGEKLRLLHFTLEIIKESYSLGGLTIATYWDPRGKKGRYSTLVYGRDFDEFGNEVERFKDKSGRTVHYVPKVQK